jgi:hypothetical protein
MYAENVALGRLFCILDFIGYLLDVKSTRTRKAVALSSDDHPHKPSTRRLGNKRTCPQLDSKSYGNKPEARTLSHMH